MAESSIQINTHASKKEFYSSLYEQLALFLEGEPNLVARMATVASVMGETRRFLWFGFYLVEGNELVLGPFSGPLACFRIKKGRGVCGTAWEKDQDLLVPNVHEFPDHIACSSLSNSEIVIPIHQKDSSDVIAVMDIDHVEIAGLDEEDLVGVKKLTELLEL